MEEILKKSNVSYKIVRVEELEEIIKSVLKDKTDIKFYPMVSLEATLKFIGVKYCEDDDYQRKLALSEFNGFRVTPRGLLNKIIQTYYNCSYSIDIEMTVIDSERIIIMFDDIKGA